MVPAFLFTQQIKNISNFLRFLTVKVNVRMVKVDARVSEDRAFLVNSSTLS